MKRSEFIRKVLHHDINTVFTTKEQIENTLDVFEDLGFRFCEISFYDRRMLLDRYYAHKRSLIIERNKIFDSPFFGLFSYGMSRLKIIDEKLDKIELRIYPLLQYIGKVKDE